MGKSREDLVKWSMKKAEEYLDSAKSNLEHERLYPVAEEIFRVVETAPEVSIKNYGTTRLIHSKRS